MIIAYETKLHLFETVEGAELVLGVGPKAASLTLKTDRFSVVYGGYTDSYGRHSKDPTVTLGRDLSPAALRQLAAAASQAADQIEQREANGYVTVTSAGFASGLSAQGGDVGNAVRGNDPGTR